jgi:hypothetical protein
MKRVVLAKVVPADQMPHLLTHAATLGITGWLPVFDDAARAMRYTDDPDAVIEIDDGGGAECDR